VSLAGWLGTGPLLAAAFEASWLPTGSAVPVAGILTGLTVGLDPGHGGFDPGVLVGKGTPGQIRECDINLAISLRLRVLLERAGARVVMSRTGDVDLAQKGEGSVEDLTRRAELVTDAGADLFLSIHCNSFPQAVWRGSQTFYTADGPPGSDLLAWLVQEELARVTRETDRSPDGRQELFILKKITVPAVIIEVGFLSNPRDRALLQNPDYQQLLCLAILFGICRFVHHAPVGPA